LLISILERPGEVEDEMAAARCCVFVDALRHIGGRSNLAIYDPIMAIYDLLSLDPINKLVKSDH
jgi:hypothetical protein